MADRRTHKARLRLLSVPPSISTKEYKALRSIQTGWCSPEAMRKILESKGLVTSKVASKCSVTRLGCAAVEKYKKYKESQHHD